MAENSHPPTVPTEAQAPTQQPLKPHRGALILVLGIVGLVLVPPGWFCCGVFGIAAFTCGIITWVMANKDLRQMYAGTMDPSGRGLTKAGKICGIISAILGIVGLVFWLLVIGLLSASRFVDTPR